MGISSFFRDERTVDYNLIRPQQTQKQIASHNNENDGKRRTDARKPAPAVPKPKETPVEKQGYLLFWIQNSWGITGILLQV